MSLDNPLRKRKDLRMLNCFEYRAVIGDMLSIKILDKITGKVYAGNIKKIFNTLEEFKQDKEDKEQTT